MNASLLHTRLAILAAFLLLIASAVPKVAHAQTPPPQNSGGGIATPAPPRFRMLRATAGTKNVERNGRFIILDPRTVFHLTDDHKVMVEFEWDGPLGPHKFQGLWKDPSGKTVVVSDFEFTTQVSPFAGYFTMLMDDTAPTGYWTLEARIDGETAGTFSFEVVPGAATAPPPTVRIPLAATDLYQQAQAVTVSVEKLDASGSQIGRGFGFVIGPSHVLTAFGNIDGASSLRVVFPNMQTGVTTQIALWDRAQDWAVLNVPTQGIAALPVPQKRSWSVGDPCYSLSTSPAGGRLIVPGTIVGDTPQPRAGERIALSFSFSPSAVGGPLLNEYGDVIGMLGGNFLPGPGANNERLAPWSLAPGTPASAVAVPIELPTAPSANASSATLADLAARGVFIPSLQARNQVEYAELSLSLDKKQNGVPWPRGTQTEFSRSDREMVVFIYWNPKTKFKGTTNLRFYDADNRPLSQTSPTNINLRVQVPVATSWTVPLTSFSPGVYRVDIYLGELPAERIFFLVRP